MSIKLLAVLGLALGVLAGCDQMYGDSMDTMSSAAPMASSSTDDAMMMHDDM